MYIFYKNLILKFIYLLKIFRSETFRNEILRNAPPPKFIIQNYLNNNLSFMKSLHKFLINFHIHKS